MSSKIVIDARESGTSTGRYIDKLIENLYRLKSEYSFVLLAKSSRADFLKDIAPSFEIVTTPFSEFSFGEQLGLKKQIEKLKPDLVHFGMVQQPIRYQGRVVTTMHDLTTIRFRNPSKNAVTFTTKQQVYKRVNKIVARKSRIILTPSEFVKKDVIAFTGIKPEKVRVTYEAADTITESAVAIQKLQNKQFIMYVGRPLPHKNLGRLVEAFAILQKSFPDLHLVLAGKADSLFQALERTVEKQGIKNVLFTGFVSEGELRWLYEHTACYVFPSLSEGFGLPGLEAMAHGTPVASSNMTCLPEIYEDAAIYFDPLDSRGMAGVISKVITDNKLAKDLHNKGLKQAAKYSWERMAKQTLEVYNRLLS